VSSGGFLESRVNAESRKPTIAPLLVVQVEHPFFSVGQIDLRSGATGDVNAGVGRL
jgi:hypothetical protein